MTAGFLYLKGHWQGEPPVEKASQAIETPAGPSLPSGDGPDERVSLHEEAIRAYNSGDYHESLRLFEELSRDLRPGEAGVLVGLGLSRFKLGRHRKAIEALEASLELAGDESRGDQFLARKFLAFAYYEADEIGMSLSSAERGLTLRKDFELQRLYDKLRKEKSARRGYVGEETFHFRVLFNGREHAGLSAAVKEMLDDAYREIGSALGHYPDRPVTVVLYTEEDFHDVTGTGQWAGGAFDGKIRLPVRGAEDSTEALRRTVYHEYSHALVRSITDRCPLWLEEGLAEYLSGDTHAGEQGRMALSGLEDSFPSSPEAARAAYASSYRAVSRLADRYGLYAVRDFLVLLSRGEEKEEAFSSAFFLSYREFLSDPDGI